MDRNDYRAEIIRALKMQPGTKVLEKSKELASFRCIRHNDSNPSAWVGEARWGCYSCAFEEPLDTLAGELGVAAPERKTGLTVEAYADRKGFTLARLQGWGVRTVTGKFGNDCVAIPYYDGDGTTLLRTKHRTPDKTFWHTDGHGTFLYGLNVLAKSPNAPVLLVEGESDCHAAWHHSIVAVGVPGKNAWKSAWAPLFAGRQVCLWAEPDADDLTAKVAADLPDLRVIDATTIGVKDIADLHLSDRANVKAVIAQAVREARPASAVRVSLATTPTIAVVSQMPDADELAQRQVDEAIAVGNRDYSTRPRFPWTDVHDALGPAIPGDLLILGARTGDGKTTTLLNWCDAMVTSSSPWLYIGMEMSAEQLRRQWAAWRLGLDIQKVLQNRWSELPSGAQEQINDELRWQLSSDVRSIAHFAPGSRIDITTLTNWTKWAVDRGVGVLIVDHFHRMSFEQGDHARASMSESVRRSKQLAVDHGISMVMAAQVNRGSRSELDKYFAPPLNALRECGTLEEEADAVLMLHRALKDGVTRKQLTAVTNGEASVSTVAAPDTIALCIRKNRKNGAVVDKPSIRLTIKNGRITDRQPHWSDDFKRVEDRYGF